MTRRMLEFLHEAAKAEPGKGLKVRPRDKRIASKARRDGYGWHTSIYDTFRINQAGRDAVAAETGET